MSSSGPDSHNNQRCYPIEWLDLVLRAVSKPHPLSSLTISLHTPDYVSEIPRWGSLDLALTSPSLSDLTSVHFQLCELNLELAELVYGHALPTVASRGLLSYERVWC